MRKLSIREFQHHFFREVKDLPLLITRERSKRDRTQEPYLIVVNYSDALAAIIEPPAPSEVGFDKLQYRGGMIIDDEVVSVPVPQPEKPKGLLSRLRGK